MKITTWNINGVKARLETALAYLKEQQPDVICFQEIKSVDEGFPREMFEELGYNVATHGQKGFNGVAHPVQGAAGRRAARPARRRHRHALALDRGTRARRLRAA